RSSSATVRALQPSSNFSADTINSSRSCAAGCSLERGTLDFMTNTKGTFFIGGDWQSPSGLPTTPVYNPSTGEIIATLPLGGESEVDAAVQAAAAAFPAWSVTPAVDRARIMFRYRSLLEQHFDELTRLISREHGKTLAESRGDLFRGMEMVEFACGAPTLLMGEVLPNIARGIDCEAFRFPLGVCVGITPFN